MFHFRGSGFRGTVLLRNSSDNGCGVLLRIGLHQPRNHIDAK